MKSGDRVIAETVNTLSVSPGERAGYWAASVDSYHCRLGYAFPRADFFGRKTLRRTKDYQLIGWQSDAVTYYRTARHIRMDSDGDYRLLLPARGSIPLWQNGRQAHLPAGMGCLVTVDQPFAFALEDGSKGLLLTIPQRVIDHNLGRKPERCRPADLTTGLGRIVAELAKVLFAESATFTAHQFDTVSGRMIELLCMHLVGDLPTSSHLADVEAAVRRYVRDHAGDPGLSGPAVARALGWSLRQLQLAFQRTDTTLRELIKEERLQLAYSRLTNPSYSHVGIAEIAIGLGFSSASAFSKAFRRRFDATPRDIRQAATLNPAKQCTAARRADR